ncbi:MAG: NADPH-dependent curcumin reductase CurA [Pseudoalteromonas tetraodonis]|jgi:NADPH-dependent curcumin reductase CurA
MQRYPSSQKAVVLARRPSGNPIADDFAVVEMPVEHPAAGQILVRNKYFSIDAGFRHWMNQGSSDEYLPEMPLGEPVVSLVLGEVLVSNNVDFAVGDHIMARLSWQQYCLAGVDDFITVLPTDIARPINEYLGVLGGTGMTAYFGVTDICRPQPGDVALISAAAGAVGTVAGQLMKAAGANVIGICGDADKCRRLQDEYGFDAAINYKSVESLEAAIAALAPQGIDIYFDNVGAETLNAALSHLRVNARVALCGSIAVYGADCPPRGPANMFELVVKRVLLKGFMYTDEVARYAEATAVLEAALNCGKIKNAEYEIVGVENAGNAFCDMFAGKNFGKAIVRLP